MKIVENLALMAITESTSSPKPEVIFTNAEMVYHLGGTLDCACRENDRIIFQNNALEKEDQRIKISAH